MNGYLDFGFAWGRSTDKQPVHTKTWTRTQQTTAYERRRRRNASAHECAAPDEATTSATQRARAKQSEPRWPAPSPVCRIERVSCGEEGGMASYIEEGSVWKVCVRASNLAVGQTLGLSPDADVVPSWLDPAGFEHLLKRQVVSEG